MGEVYLARDTRLGREVAIKVLPALFSSDRDRLRRFEQEAKAASLLNHPPGFSAVKPDASPALERAVRRCVEKNPEEGFQSARDVAYALEETITASAAQSPTSEPRFPRPRTSLPSVSRWSTWAWASRTGPSNG